MTTVVATALVGLGQRADPARTLSWALLGMAVFVFLPAVMVLLLAAVCVLLAAFVLAVGAVARPLRGPTGAQAFARELVAMPWSLPARYLAALSAVRSPAWWGLAAGIGLGTAILFVQFVTAAR